MSQTLHFLNEHSLAFPDPHFALSEPNGLLALGGDLSPSRLIEAYANGIFPWYSQDEPIMWWSPDPRAIIPTSDIRVNKTLRKFLKKMDYRITCNYAFEEVISQCADAPFRHEETWIVEDMQVAYHSLHKLGHAHSIEVWQDKQLVGGLYGVAINGFFSGESMFYQAPNASKVALLALSQLLSSHDINFIDCQINNPFLASMGAIEISRDEFIQQKNTAIKTSLPSGVWHPRELYLTT
ncbi:leucyl/phenylalanyl-tRNA--protein transferase [Thalassotalea sp. LPB0316]|uniref:leucyl/phenylalanyl-tRNA--protein transferase n=1 Tax=Thalassotalea sp. LPB0316 TaxID=2769490 RepID=UPI001865CA2C|nr:leucyl/phenylalanyl-tRNA--protein transferase [Thalassotalea sp. LPB0316]QOL25029.1 leucyl/phenylalanyl-tRNA--protein transferase [Thalassotalea sp. LPB0316]